MMHPLSRFGGVALSVMAWLCVMGPLHASAQVAEGETPNPAAPARQTRHVALLVDAAAEVDAFTKMYLYEVIAGRLQQHGFAVTAVDPGAASRPALECVAAPSCLEPLMHEHRAPWLVAVRLEPSGEGRLRVSLRTSDGSSTFDAEDEESAIATALDRTLSATDPTTVPCLIVLDSEIAATAFRLRGETTDLPHVVPAGEHAVRLEAPDREPWEGPLVCRGGGVLRVHVR